MVLNESLQWSILVTENMQKNIDSQKNSAGVGERILNILGMVTLSWAGGGGSVNPFMTLLSANRTIYQHPRIN